MYLKSDLIKDKVEEQNLSPSLPFSVLVAKLSTPTYCLIPIHFPFHRNPLSSHSFASGCPLDSCPSPRSSEHIPQVYIIHKKTIWSQKIKSPPSFPSQVNSLSGFTFFCCSGFQDVEYLILLLQGKYFFWGFVLSGSWGCLCNYKTCCVDSAEEAFKGMDKGNLEKW